MSNFVGKSPFSNLPWVAIETMRFHIAHTKIFLGQLRFAFGVCGGVPMNNLAPMKNCPVGARQPKLDAGVMLLFV